MRPTCTADAPASNGFWNRPLPRWSSAWKKTPGFAAAAIDLFEHSGYFADQLLRYPELLDEVGEPFQLEGGELRDAVALRRFYRRQMLRIQSESMLEQAPVFSTLGKTSVLADSVIAAAYRIAVNEAPPPATSRLPALRPDDGDRARPPRHARVRPGQRCRPELRDPRRRRRRARSTGPAWRSASSVPLAPTPARASCSSSIPRLRPNGREGDLVQTEGAYKSYFAHGAEAWEGISYMKARAIAGNLDRATRFLHELAGRGLAALRAEHALARRPAQPCARAWSASRAAAIRSRQGIGGYYDIDFALMYLRLREAGVFFRVLNTPERIEVIERMGSLSQQDAGVPARGRDLLPGAGPRAARLHRPDRRQPAGSARATRNPYQPGAPLDAGTPACTPAPRDLERDPPAIPGNFLTASSPSRRLRNRNGLTGVTIERMPTGSWAILRSLRGVPLPGSFGDARWHGTAITRMYDFDFTGSHRILDQLHRRTPRRSPCRMGSVPPLTCSTRWTGWEFWKANSWSTTSRSPRRKKSWNPTRTSAPQVPAGRRGRGQPRRRLSESESQR